MSPVTGPSGFSVACWFASGPVAVVKVLADRAISLSGAVLVLFWFVSEDGGTIARSAAAASISRMLFSALLGCGTKGATAAGAASAVVVSVGIASVIGAISGLSAGDIVDSEGPTAGKFDRPQIIACHT